MLFVDYSVTIEGITNPSTAGGTGNFMIITYLGVNVLNQNLIFGVIGVAGSVGTLASTVVSLETTGVSTAGSYTSYNFQFETATDIPAGSYFVFSILDTDFVIPAIPKCVPYAINGVTVAGIFTCNTIGQNIYVYGLQEYLVASSFVGMTISLGNPTYVKTTSTFTFATYRANTTVMYDQGTGISGVSITAGLVNNITFTQVNPTAIAAQGKDMDYILKFTPTNQLYNLTVITIQFPPTFVIDVSSNKKVYIMYGLEDNSESNPVGLSITSNIITLSYYLEYTTPREIAMFIRAINPSNEGSTTALKIITWSSYLLLTEMDSDIVTAVTTITDNPSPTSNSLTATSYIAGGVATTLTFKFKPTLEVPTSGLIIINIPRSMGWSAVLATSNIVITPSGGSSFSPSSVSVSQNQITMIIPPPSTGAALPISLTHSIVISSVFLTPATNNTYAFDCTTMTDISNVLESWSSFLTITSPGFVTTPTALAVSNFYSTVGSYSVLDVSFTTNYVLRDGSPQNLASDLRGFIQFSFTGVSSNLGWTSLSSGDTIPCKSVQGIVPVTDESLTCTITFGSPVLVVMNNFQSVLAGTFVKVRFPNFLNPTSAGTITVGVNLFSKQNRIWTMLNTGTVTYAVSGTSSPTVTTIPTTPTASTSQYTFSSATTPEVSSTVTLAFDAQLTTAIAVSSVIIIQLPSGWIPDATVASGVECTISAVVTPCIAYEGINWISIELSSTQSITTTETSWSFSNLQVPFMSTSSPGSMTIYVLSGNTAVQEYIHNTFPVYATPAFSDSTLVVPNKGLGYVDVHYTISMRIPNEIPAGASIEIDFPSSYNLLKSTPSVTFNSSTLTSISDTQVINFSPTLYRLYITNFQTYPADTAFSVDIWGVKNPSSGTSSTGWNIYITYTDSSGTTGTIASAVDFDQFTYGAPFSSGNINFQSISAFPLNADEYAMTNISITPQTSIAAGGVIQIIFPSDYKALPSPPECYLSGGISTFESCVLSGNTITITTDADYLYGGLNITIMNVLNPDYGTTGGFVIQTSYDGVTLDITDTTSLVGRTLTTSAKANTITEVALSNDPQNEGEVSAFNFTFLPSDEIDTSMVIMLGFPYQFDMMLGPIITCASTNGLIGTISCTAGNRWVTVTGFSTYIPDVKEPITIMVYGVVNPNSGTTSGEFMVGTIVAGESAFVDLNPSFGTLTSLVAPGWASLYQVTPSNLNSRLTADYYFNFSTSSTIPKTSSDGAIYVDLPSQFIIEDGTIQCSTDTTDFAAVLECTVLRDRIIINGQTSDYTGDVSFTIRALTNPVYDGQSDIIYVKTYDGVNQRVIQRSYKNLDPFSFYYVYPGPLVIINNDEDIYVDRGTRSVLLPITVSYPCALNLTFKPIAAQFPIVPFISSMTVGMVEVDFQISIPEAFYTGNYSLDWETIGDTIPAFYTPIRRSYVIVTSNTGIVINVPAIPEVPYGGNSLPIILTISEPPDIQIYVTVNFQTSYPGLTLSTNTVTFYAGNTSAYFIIYSSNNVTVTGGTIVSGGEVIMQLSGVNSDLYTLSSSTSIFAVTGADNIAPSVASVTFSNITQATAAATVNASELTVMYYMIALQGSLAPSLSEMLSYGPANYTSTRSRYFEVSIPTGLSINISLTELEASLDWSLYVYLIDRGNNSNTPYIANFTCLCKYLKSFILLKLID